MNRTQRQILINPHSSGNTVPAGILNLGEIAVQHNSVQEAALYVETVADSDNPATVAKFLNASAVTVLIESAQTDLQTQIDAINDQVGLPHGEGHFASGIVWDAIEQVYEEMTAGTAAANTKVESANTPDTEKYMTLTSAKDAETSSITYTIGLTGIDERVESAYTILNDSIETLSAGTIQLSADTNATIQQLSAGTIQLSADTVEYVKEVSGNIETVIETLSGVVESFSSNTVNTFAELSGSVIALSAATEGVIDSLDYTGVTPDGRAIVNVTEENGIITAIQGNISANTVYIEDAQELLTATTVEGALEELALKSAAITIDNADGSINVTPTTAGTDINVNIKSGEHVLVKSNDTGDTGLYTDLDLVKITEGLPATVKERYQLLATDDSQIGVNIDIAKDSHIVSIEYINDTASTYYQNLKYTYIDASGNTQAVYVNMSDLVFESEFKSGVTSTNGIVHGVVDPTSETFLTVGADGFKLSGVQQAINDAVDALDYADSAVTGQYVTEVDETNGVITVSRANVSEAVLNNYAKGSDGSAVAATDTINQAVSKLENQIDAAKAAATTKVVEGTDTGNNMTIESATSADDSVTYTINLTDVASAAELDAVEAGVGLSSAGTHVQTSGYYTSSADTVVGEIAAIDAALKDVSDKLNGVSVSEGASTGETYVELAVTNDGQGATAITINDSVLAAEIVEINSAITVEAAAREAADDLLRGTEASSTSAETSLWGLKKLIGEVSKTFAVSVEGESGNDALVEVTKTEGDSGDTYNVASTQKLQDAVALAETSVQEVGFAAVATKDSTAYGSNAGAEIVNGTNGKKINIDLSYLKVDCGEY